jgi:hypothetical protein
MMMTTVIMTFIVSFFIICMYHFIHSQALIVQDGPLASLFRVSWSHTYRHTVGLLWTSDQPSQRPLPAQDNTTYKYNRHPCPKAGFEPTTPAIKWPQTYALDRAATGIGCMYHLLNIIVSVIKFSRLAASASVISIYLLFYLYVLVWFPFFRPLRWAVNVACIFIIIIIFIIWLHSPILTLAFPYGVS